MAVLQARHLAGLGLEYRPEPFRLEVGVAPGEEVPELPGPGPWLAVAPGSGQSLKNWPLSHFYEAARALAWEHRLGVVWVTGPAEEAALPFIRGLAAAQGHLVLAEPPLARVAGFWGAAGYTWETTAA